MLVRHIPHSSTLIPTELRSDFVVSDEELQSEILRVTDRYTEELFADPDSEAVVFPISRLVCDPERFLPDAHEPAAKVGMGVCYTHGSKGQEIRKLDSVARNSIISSYYHPHHAQLNEIVAKHLEQFDESFVLDCHSFPTKPLPTEDLINIDRPHFCLGFVEYHAPEELILEIKLGLEAQGYSVSLNSPYQGSLIPSEYFQKEPSVLGLMVEVNRSLYMDELTGKKSESFDAIKSLIRLKIIEKIKTFIMESRCDNCEEYIEDCV